MTHPTNAAYADQTYMVEFEVPGSLDGVTPGPLIRAPSTVSDPQGIYRPVVEGDLGLIDPDYVVTDANGLGTIGIRYVGFTWIDASVVGAAGAVIEVVDAVDGSVLVQKTIAPLVGLSTYYNKEGFTVPQGSLIRISGFAAGPTPHRVRLWISYLTEEEVAEAQADVPSSGGGGSSAVSVSDESILVEPNVANLNFLGAGVTAVAAGAGQVDVTVPSASWADTLLVGNLSVGGGTNNPTIATGDDVLPQTDNDPDLGSITLRMRQVVSRVSLAVAVAGAGTNDITFGANSVGEIVGTAHALVGGATARLQLSNPATPQESGLSVRAAARADVAGSVAGAVVAARGAGVAGFVRAETAHIGDLRASGLGAQASGYVSAFGYNAIILASGRGAHAFGYSKSYPGAGYGTARMQATGDGAFVFGLVQYFGDINASADGASAGGIASGGAFVQNLPGQILASAVGARAGGAAIGGDIRASGIGSEARGHARTNELATPSTIQATAAGSHAGGQCVDGLIEATGVGSFIHGAVLTVGGVTKATMRASGYGSFVLGTADNDGSLIDAQGQASFICGLAITYANTATAEIIVGPVGVANGAWAGGAAAANGANTARISAEENGAFAFGKASSGYIQAAAEGSFAFGEVSQGVAPGNAIRATGRGAFAFGAVRVTFDILASGEGSLAQGSANTADVSASAANAVQFGPGTNSVADSVRVGGGGLHLKGTTGAFGAAADGQIWVSGANVYIRSGGATRNCTNIP